MTRTRLGLVADTHVPEAGPDLPCEAYEALAGCAQILHCGDLHTLDVVDRLERIAPTLVSRGNGDRRSPRGARPGVPDDPRVADTHVVIVNGFRVGISHDLGHTEVRSDVDVVGLLARRFDGRVDIAVSGHSHVPLIRGLADGTALVNPGSPTMPYGYVGIVGTLALLDLEETSFEITVIDLATGSTQLRMAGPAAHPQQRGPRPTGGR